MSDFILTSVAYLIIGVIVLLVATYLMSIVFDAMSIVIDIILAIKKFFVLFSRENHDSDIKKEKQHHYFSSSKQNSKSLWRGSRKVKITYIDVNHDITDRRIQINNVYVTRHGDINIQAYCFMRNEQRTFKADNILSLTSSRGSHYTDFSSYMSRELSV